MAPVLGIVFLLVSIISLVCWIIILIQAFQDEVWKGLLFFFCGFYAIYYAIFEFDHEKKALIVAGFLSSLAIAIIMRIFLMTTVGATGLQGIQP